VGKEATAVRVVEAAVAAVAVLVDPAPWGMVVQVATAALAVRRRRVVWGAQARWAGRAARHRARSTTSVPLSSSAVQWMAEQSRALGVAVARAARAADRAKRMPSAAA